MLNLSLSEVVNAHHTILVTGQDELVLAHEVGIEACGNLVVGEHARLDLLSFHVEHSDLVIGAASN